MVLGKVLQLDDPQSALLQIFLHRCFVQKSDSAALHQHLLEDVHIPHLKQRVKILKSQILSAQAAPDNFPVAGAFLPHQQRFTQQVGKLVGCILKRVILCAHRQIAFGAVEHRVVVLLMKISLQDGKVDLSAVQPAAEQLAVLHLASTLLPMDAACGRLPAALG